MKFFNITTLVLLIVMFSIGSCTNDKPKVNNANNDFIIAATLFQQSAAEKRALSYQAYNTAKLMLNNALKSARLTKKLAVVVDIDETVLDNSPFEAKSIIENTDYPKYWKEWCDLAIAKPIAGSLEFLNYAKSKGVDVFYITNRKIELKESTIKNLKEKGFPDADSDHLLMRTETSDKELRRKKVEESHYIVLLIGDNLGDFLSVFDNAEIEKRFDLTDSIKNEFGSRFIVLPNPMYGNWLNLLTSDNKELTKEQKIKALKKHLKAF